MFVTAALLSLIRRRQVRPGTLHDVLFLLALVVTFVVQVIQGVEVIAQPGDTGAVNTIAGLVIVCFLIGIARAWELIGGLRSFSRERSGHSSGATSAASATR